jgi:hypothetical protein
VERYKRYILRQKKEGTLLSKGYRDIIRGFWDKGVSLRTGWSCIDNLGGMDLSLFLKRQRSRPIFFPDRKNYTKRRRDNGFRGVFSGCSLKGGFLLGGLFLSLFGEAKCLESFKGACLAV